jgi:glycosyltransferase involved in cell wall biosynthesis
MLVTVPHQIDRSSRAVSCPKQESASPSGIALVGLGLNSYINPNVAEALQRAFSRYQIDWIDLGPLVMRRKLMPFLLWSYTTIEFAREVGLNARQLKRRRHWTTYLFKQRSLTASEQIAKSQYLFSMQIQSTFDASVAGLPHFVYTDNTMLANLQYKAARKADLPVTHQWIAQERRLYQNARACFVMSHNVGRSLVKDYGCAQDKVVCVYSGHNVPIQVNPEKKYDQKNILFVGVDWERKGGPELLAAFRLVRERIPDATLTIVGCSPQIEEPGCQIVGRVAPSDLGRYYAEASVFCMPTRQEPFGIVFVEAMAHHLPIVATDVGAIPDFLSNGHNGFRIAPGDIQGLAHALIHLLRNPPLCRQMGEHSHAVSKIYTWDNVAATMRTVIQRFVPTLR